MEPVTFFRSVKENYPAARKKYDEILKKENKELEIDGLYRVYHCSFKMYDELQITILSNLDVLLSLLGITYESKKVKPLNEMLLEELSFFKKLDLDRIFINSVKDASNRKFSMDRNKRENWYNDQKALIAAVYHTKIGLESIMAVAENYYKNNKLLGEGGILSEKEALAEHLLNFRDYRFTDIKKLKESTEKT